MKKTKISKAILLSTGLALAVTLAACSSTSNSTGSNSTATPTSEITSSETTPSTTTEVTPSTTITTTETTTTTTPSETYENIKEPKYTPFNGTLIEEATKVENGITLNAAKAYTEGAYAEWTVASGAVASDYSVYYTFDNTQYIPVHKQLIRVNGTTARVDIVGLTAARYKIKIVNNKTNDSAITETINVIKDDRSGYAHWGNTTGVGAYENDGTLKDDAIIVYVSDETKNTVKAMVNGTVQTGLVNIIKAAQSADEALDIRILGEIQTQQWNKKTHGTGKSAARMENLNSAFSAVDWEQTTANELLNPGMTKSNNYYKIDEADIIKYGINSMSDDEAKGITHLDGLTNNVLKTIATESSGYQEYDSYYNELDVKFCNNITVEGIGADAKIYQWGFCFNQCNSIEVKNIEFSGYNEDAIGIQGASSDVTLYSDYWIHNCTFNSGVNNWDVTYENDKNEGDGSTDFKSAHDLTISYCRYNGTHKTALIGSGSSSYQYNVTFHHNYYNKCGSRLPFTRNSNFHIYNCYYNGSTGTNMQIQSNAYTFIEGCYFENTNKTFTSDGTGVIKLYKNIVDSTSSTSGTGINYCDSRTEPLSSSCKADKVTDFSNFDTNSKLFYYNSTNNISDVSLMLQAADVKAYIPTVAGAGALATIDYSKNFVEKNDPYVDTKVTATYNESTSAPTTAGFYYTVLDNSSPQAPTAEANLTSSTIVQDDNGKIIVTDTSAEATTAGYVMLEDAKKYTTGTHTYTFNITLQGVGSSWYFLRLLDGNGEDYLCIGTTKNTKHIGCTLDIANIATAENETDINSNSAFVANTTYTITISIDYDNDSAVVSVGSDSVTLTGVTAETISGFKFFTAKSATNRSFTVNSITIE